MSQLKRGAILSYGIMFLTNTVGLLLTPFIVKKLGDGEYGLYMLIGSFVGYLMVLDLGLNNTIIRYVSKYRAEKDKISQSNFLSTCIYIYAAMSFFLVVIGLFLFINLDSIFSDSLSVIELSKAKVMFLVLIFNIAITLPGGAFEAICTAYGEFVYPKKMRILRYVVRTIAVVALLYYGGDAIGLVIVDTVMNLSIIISNGYFVIKKLKVRFKFYSFDQKLINQIFSYSFWIFLVVIVYQFQWKAGQVLLGLKTNTTLVAIYAIGVFLGSYYATFATSISSMFLPKATKMFVGKANGKEISDMSIKIARITLIVLFLILGGFILFGKEFIELWVGATYKNSWVIGLFIMVTLTNSLTQSFLTSILKAMNLYRFKSLTYLLFVTLGLLLGYLLIDEYNEVGLITGVCVGVVISQIVLNIYFMKKIKFNIVRFYNEVYLKMTVFFGVFLVVGYFINKLFPDYHWVSLFLKLVMFTIIYLFVTYFSLMNEYEKKLFRSMLIKIPFFNKNRI